MVGRVYGRHRRRLPVTWAPFIPPRWNDGPKISFTMSLFDPYNVYPMQTSLYISLSQIG